MPPFLASREAALLVVGVVLLVGVAFVVSRVLRSLRHGFSIRLQLFFAILGTSLLASGVIGLWVVDRLQARAAELALQYGASSQAVLALLRETGPKMALLFALLAVAAAGAAFALGRAVAHPIEGLTHAAEAIARGERHAVLPPPVGREVRRLSAAFESMRRALEDRHAMERFVADLSHELKNPVSAIRAATEVLQEGAAEDAEARPRFLARIDEASRRLEALLQDLLELARLEARGPEPERGAVAFDEVVQRAIGNAAGSLEEKQIRVEVELAACRMRGDARWLQRAVENLLSNAIRYSPEGGVVEVALRLEDAHAVLTVRDHGAGVPRAMEPRLFHRFVTDRREAGQTGLGLAIVRSVAELHGGDAQLLACEGAGACIQVRVAR